MPPLDGLVSSRSGQEAWCFCEKCCAMFYEGEPSGAKGRCPVSGGHVAQGFNFYLPHDVQLPSAQPGWRFCHKCWGMFYEGDRAGPKGRCPAGAAHEAHGFKFILPHDLPDAPWAQPGWRFCHKCWGMFYEGDRAGPKGRCPAGAAHEAHGFKFILPHWGFPSNRGVPERSEIFVKVNHARLQQETPCSGNLLVDLRLDGVAQAHSQDLADHPGLWEKTAPNGYKGHRGSDNSLAEQRIQRATGSPGQENVSVRYFFGAASPPTPKDAFDWWMSSEDHRETLLNCGHTRTGVGFAIGSGIIPAGQDGAGQRATFHYYTQVFHA